MAGPFRGVARDSRTGRCERRRGSSAQGAETQAREAAMSLFPSVLASGALLAIAAVAAIGGARASDLNDYPTSARADYVFACMKVNGETREVLDKCSCSIDVIATIIPYDRYVTAETILSMSQVTGPMGAEFRSTEPSRTPLQEFRRAQAEAEVRCF
jgi:hypothetical protein